MQFELDENPYRVDDKIHDSNGTSYLVKKKLGGGGNSVVLEVSDEREIHSFAVKILKFKSKKKIAEFEQEKSMLKEFSTPEYANTFLGLVAEGDLDLTSLERIGRGKYKDLHTNKYKFYIMHLAGKDIQNFLCTTTFSDEQEVFPYIKHLAESLKIIHEKNYVHRDIKPQNILLQEQVPKLVDFGLMVKEDACKKKKGPKYWPSPEFLELCDQDEHCSKKTTDVFQLGCIFFFLITKKYPIGNISISEIGNSFSKLKPIIEKMISYDKSNRYENGQEVYDDLNAI